MIYDTTYKDNNTKKIFWFDNLTGFCDNNVNKESKEGIYGDNV